MDWQKQLKLDILVSPPPPPPVTVNPHLSEAVMDSKRKRRGGEGVLHMKDLPSSANHCNSKLEHSLLSVNSASPAGESRATSRSHTLTSLIFLPGSDA